MQNRYTLEWKNSLSEIEKDDWDRLAEPLQTPLLEWDWLNLLERSGSVQPQTGWLPCHLTAWKGHRLVAAAPLYVKGHSAGEFVFDHAWANLAEQLGVSYYPKLVGMSPFSPVVGYRFLLDPEEDERRITEQMVGAIDQFCDRHRLSGCSFLFVDPQWRRRMESFGYTAWRHQSYAWHNPDFESFADYLAGFNANQRRNIKREREAIRRRGIRIQPVIGRDIPEYFFELMYTYYSRTNDRYGPWGCKYLTPAFFRGLRSCFRHRLLLMAAFEPVDNGRPIGISFLLRKRDRLYGRYWGSARTVRELHFNACYYSPIEWAIANGIRVFDPGMGSSHKSRRGFTAFANHSLHRFYDTRMNRILLQYIGEINRREQEYIEALNESMPLRQPSA